MPSSIFDTLASAGVGAALRVHLTPDMARELLDVNKNYRPLRQGHIDRIARAIREGRWCFNGDTIKISTSRDILDGQHRLWAIGLLEGVSIDTLIVMDINKEAFDTIDTIRATRTFSDTVALEGHKRHLAAIGAAAAWMARYEAATIETWREPRHRVENHDIKRVVRAHPNLASSVAAVSHLRTIENVGRLGFFHYVLSGQNAALAEHMLRVLTDPADVAVGHPFFKLRHYLMGADKKDPARPIKNLAIMIKAANLAYQGREISSRLEWTPDGARRDRFPALEVRNLRKEGAV